MSSGREDTTGLLIASRRGDRGAFDRLFAHLYAELRAIAHHRLVDRRGGDSIDTTGLVHELYLRLVDQSAVQWHDRAHFLALASRAMRFILVDYARSRSAQKRGGGQADASLDRLQIAADERAADLLALDDALEELERSSERLARLVEYRFFGGLSYEEIADAVGCSVPTVKRDWTRARTWLYRSMQPAEE